MYSSPTRPIESDEYYVHISTFSCWWSSSSLYDQEAGAMAPAGGAMSSPIFFLLVLHRAEKIYPAAPKH